MRLAPRGLRARAALGFAILGLVLSTVLSIATYELARWYLLGSRQTIATRQALLNAEAVDGALSGTPVPSDQDVLDALAKVNSRAVLSVRGVWYSAVVDLTETRLPRELRSATLTGAAQRQRIMINRLPYFVVGIPLSANDAAYFEFVPATEYENTLRTLALVLFGVASATTAAGAISGWMLSRRVVRPLNAVAETAQAMSDGDLRRRLDVGDDPSLEPVATAFNAMASSLEDRIERERRFTADVSHELRTPLTAMSSAVYLAQRSKTQERTSMAIDVLADQVEHLRNLTVELLELARVDSDRVDTELEPVDVARLAAGQLAAHEADASLLVTDSDEVVHQVNRLRFERVIGNLVENAARYGRGAVRMWCGHLGDGTLRVEVDDAGSGVPADERLSIFGRFHRGSTEAAPGAPKGTGLGLSLVHEYVRLEGGRVWVEDRPGGGARFVVEVPAR